MLAAHVMNHHRAVAGKRASNPLVRYNLRVWVASYDEFAMEKRAEEDSPWANIITRAPSQPHFLDDMTAAVNNPMWPIDEYAMRAFRSVWRMQIALVTQAPTRHRDISIGARVELRCGKSELSRMRPYLPSFSRMAARIMEPASGASTCAFGSHRCRE